MTTRLALLVAPMVLALTLVLILLIVNRSEPRGPSAAEISQDFAPRAIQNEELFLPPEPDYLPAVILSREPKTTWTEEDAAKFWTDPATLDKKVLLERAVSAIDELMETVP